MRRGVHPTLLLCAHASAVASLRHLSVTVPSSLDVLAELRRGTRDLVVSQADVKEACAALSPPLPLADADPPPRPPLRRGWPL